MTPEQIEQAAQQHADSLRVPSAIPGVLVPLLHDIAKDSYTQGAQDALALQWIPVEERLPEEGQEVLLYDANSVRHYVIGWRRKKGDNKSQWALSNGFVEDKDITHWLSIPKLNPEKAERL